MNSKTESEHSRLDTIKLMTAAAVVVAGVLGFYYFADQLLVVRVGGLLVAVGIAVAIALTSEQGRNVVDFLQDSRTELRKVVWPSRSETLQSSLAVLVMVIIVGLFLWLLDQLLLWTVRALVG